MSWLRIDDQFPEGKKVEPLSDKAFRFHVTALCYCARNLTDGVVTEKATKVVAAICDTAPRKWVDELVAAGLWHRVEAGGWEINDYLEYNPSAASVIEKRDQARQRMASSRKRAREQTANVEENFARSDSERSHSPSPDPIPQRALALSPTEARTPLEGLMNLAKSSGDGEKMRRATSGQTEAALASALELALMPGARDPLAVALSELGKARKEKAA